jgi:OOP family OmpA-OmpF porin
MLRNQSGRSIQIVKGRKFTLPTVLVSLALLAACGTTHIKTSADSNAGGEISFPAPAHATMPEGIFVNIDNLRNVAPGMTKGQLYNLLGAPHFSEGVFGVRKWDYIFDFRRQNGDQFSCQYQVDFDKDDRARDFHWKPESCKSVLAAPAIAEAPAPVALPKEPIRLSTDALFDFDHSNLTAQGRSRLSALLKQVQSASQIETILVAGYTDRIGSDSYNQALSERRAESVRDYLIDGGVSPGAVRVEGHGKGSPLVSCADSNYQALIACLAPNRRVELSGMSRS